MTPLSYLVIHVCISQCTSLADCPENPLGAVKNYILTNCVTHIFEFAGLVMNVIV